MKPHKIITSATRSISLTGHTCELSCMHCGGKFLKGMIPIEKVDPCALKRAGIKTLLISGGMNAKTYNVPVYEHLQCLKTLKDHGFKLNFHTGLLDICNSKFDEFMALADRISFDLNFSKDVLQKVYGMNKVTEKKVKHVFEAIYQKGGDKLVPHICAGLDFGKISSEYRVLDYLSSFNKISKIVFIVFVRKKGTEMENSPLPAIDELKKLFDCAVKQYMPNVKIILGCMRSFRGEYAKNLEQIAAESGIYGIVNPRYNVTAEKEISDVCCAF